MPATTIDSPAPASLPAHSPASGPAISLREAQLWMQAAIAREYDPHARGTGAVLTPIENMILPSATLAPAERLAIYQRSIYARFHDALSEDFSTIHTLIGDDEFHKLVRAYLAEYPACTFGLGDLAQHMPRFLRRKSCRVPRRLLMLDLARLERALVSVFHRQAVPGLKSEDFAELPVERLATAHFEMAPTLRVLAFDHRADAILTAIRQNEPLPDLSPCKTYTAVFRKEFTVWRQPLSAAKYAMLRTLTMGYRVSVAIEAAVNAWGGDDDEQLESAIFSWFGEWVGDGFIVRVHLSE